jgi:hypothetical protein
MVTPVAMITPAAPSAETRSTAPSAETRSTAPVAETRSTAPVAETRSTAPSAPVATTTIPRQKGLLRNTTLQSSIILPGTVLKNGEKIVSKNGITEVGIMDKMDETIQEMVSQFYFKNKNNKRMCCGDICSFQLPKITEEECRVPITENNYVYNNEYSNGSIDTVTFSKDLIIIKLVNGEITNDKISDNYSFKKITINQYPSLIPVTINSIVKLYDIDGKYVKEINWTPELKFDIEMVKKDNFEYILVRDEGIFLFNSNDELIKIF